MPKKGIYLNNPNLPSIDAQFEYTPKMVSELKKCASSVLHFSENYFQIINVDEGRQKITLHSYQKKALRMMRDNRFSLLLFSRQSGKSTISTIYCLWTACFNTDQNILIVANKESTAKEIFKRIRMAYEELPNWLKPAVKEYQKESLELANGSRIGITTTTGTAGRGSSANLLFVDEADWIESNLLEEFWASVYPIISSSKKSKIILASTPRDTSGLFYKLYDGSIKGTNSWVSLRIPWDQVPGRDEQWKKETIGSLGDISIWRREFEIVFDEIGEASFDTELFEQMKANTFSPLYVFDEGRYLLWETPNEEKIYVAGVDIAEGLGKDATVIQILDITDLRKIKQVACYHNNRISPSEFTPKLHEILQHWGSPLALIERNSCGGQVVDNLKKDFNYENIVSYGYKETSTKNRLLGVMSHTNTKYRGVMNQRYWINTAKSVQINDIHTVNEFKDFVRLKNGTWSSKAGSNDDRVMSFIWALMILSEDLIENYFEIIEKDENNKPLVIRQMEYEVKYFMNPTSIYTNEKDGVGGSSLPILFEGKGMNNSNPDLDELYGMGWKSLDDINTNNNHWGF